MEKKSMQRIGSLVLAMALLVGVFVTASASNGITLSSDGVRNGILLNEYGMHGSQFVSSPYGDQVPSRSMPLKWENAPAGTKSYAIYVDDITYPWTHWMAVNIKATSLPANASRSGAVSMVQGRNDFGTVGYGGPTPPDKDHLYDMTVFALDVDSVPLSEGFGETAYWDAILDHIIDEVTITATYRRSYAADPEPPVPPIDANQEYVLTLTAGEGGSISLGQSGTYKGGDVVQIGATAHEGYLFSRWTSSNGGAFGSATAANTTFTAPGGDTTVTATFVKAGSGGNTGGGGGGGGSSRSGRRSSGSSGGSSVADRKVAASVTAVTARATSSNVSPSGAVNANTIKSELDKAISQSTGTGVALRTKNAVSISAAVLKNLVGTASASNKTVMLHADTTTADGKVQGRLYVDPAKLSSRSGDLQLGVYTEADKVSKVQAHLETYFTGPIAVIKLEQGGSLGATLEVAAQVSLSGMDTGNLAFYHYDIAGNSCTRINEVNYYVDSNGYLHFSTSQGGYIAVTTGSLQRK